MAVPDLQDAFIHLQQEDVDAAISVLEQKIDELPAHLTAHVLLARAYEAKREWPKALKCWKNVCFLMPNSPVGQDGKARILQRLDTNRGGKSAPDSSTAESEEAPSSTRLPAPRPDSPESLPSNEASAPPVNDAENAAASPEPDQPDEDTAPAQSPSAAPVDDAMSDLEELRRQAEDTPHTSGPGPPDATSAPSTSSETPEEQLHQLEDEGDDLERLIDELESARIEPDPDMDDVAEPDLDDDVDDIVSETLARIHEAQDQYRRAAQIYVKLASQEPDQAREYLQKASDMREKAEAQEKEDTDSE